MIRRMLIAALLALPAPAMAGPLAHFAEPSTDALMQRATAAFAAGRHRAARRDFHALAMRAEPAAETMLGIMAARGLGGQQSDAVAAGWFLRAARRGYAPAELALAERFAHGLGVKQDRTRAQALAQSAAMEGLDAATEFLASEFAER